MRPNVKFWSWRKKLNHRNWKFSRKKNYNKKRGILCDYLNTERNNILFFSLAFLVLCHLTKNYFYYTLKLIHAHLYTGATICYDWLASLRLTWERENTISPSLRPHPMMLSWIHSHEWLENLDSESRFPMIV